MTEQDQIWLVCDFCEKKYDTVCLKIIKPSENAVTTLQYGELPETSFQMLIFVKIILS